MARTIKAAQADTTQSQSQNTDNTQRKFSGAELNRRRYMSVNSLRKRGVAISDKEEKLHVLISITESTYHKRDIGVLTDEEATKVIDDAVKRHQEGYNPLDNPDLL